MQVRYASISEDFDEDAPPLFPLDDDGDTATSSSITSRRLSNPQAYQFPPTTNRRNSNPQVFQFPTTGTGRRNSQPQVFQLPSATTGRRTSQTGIPTIGRRSSIAAKEEQSVGYQPQSYYPPSPSLMKRRQSYAPLPALSATRRKRAIAMLLGWVLALMFATLFLWERLSKEGLVPEPEAILETAKAVLHVGGKTEYAPKLAQSNERSKVTIVSGFYKIESGKKHRVSEYNEWMHNFLANVELPIIFYCSPSEAPLIASLRGSLPITILASHETPFSMPPLDSLGGRDWALRQNEMDWERGYHVPDVYGVWTAKPWMMQHAAESNPYGSEYFFWADAGAFRQSDVNHTFTGLEGRLDKLYSSVPRDTLVLSSIDPWPTGLEFVKSVQKNGELIQDNFLQGGWYGGRLEGLKWWAEETLKVVVRQVALGRFAGKEQPVWTQAARLNWEKVYIQLMAHQTGDCGPDPWFAFEFWADGTGGCEVPAWEGPRLAEEDTVARLEAGFDEAMVGGSVAGAVVGQVSA